MSSCPPTPMMKGCEKGLSVSGVETRETGDTSMDIAIQTPDFMILFTNAWSGPYILVRGYQSWTFLVVMLSKTRNIWLGLMAIKLRAALDLVSTCYFILWDILSQIVLYGDYMATSLSFECPFFIIVIALFIVAQSRLAFSCIVHVFAIFLVSLHIDIIMWQLFDTYHTISF